MIVKVVVAHFMGGLRDVKDVGRRLDHCIAFGSECDDSDRIPVAGVRCPAPRVFCPCVLVEHIARLQDAPLLSGMLFRWTDVADGTVAMVRERKDEPKKRRFCASRVRATLYNWISDAKKLLQS